MSGAGTFIAVTRAVAWRSLWNAVRNPALIVPALIFPMFFFLAFAGGLSSVGDVPGFDFPTGYTAFQFVWIVLQSCAFTGAFMGFNAAGDFESGFARRLMLAAPHRGGIVAGYVLAAAVRALFTIALLSLAGLVSGMNVDGSPLELLGLVALGVMATVAGSLFALGVALRIRSMKAAPLMQTPIFLALFLSPVWVPLDLLEGWIKGVASVNPVTALIEAGRGLISGQPDGTALAFGVALALIAGFALWSWRGLRAAERSA